MPPLCACLEGSARCRLRPLQLAVLFFTFYSLITSFAMFVDKFAIYIANLARRGVKEGRRTVLSPFSLFLSLFFLHFLSFSLCFPSIPSLSLCFSILFPTFLPCFLFSFLFLKPFCYLFDTTSDEVMKVCFTTLLQVFKNSSVDILKYPMGVYAIFQDVFMCYMRPIDGRLCLRYGS